MIVIEDPKFDVSGVREFKVLLAQHWDKRIETVALDFSNVRFIDSSGIGALLGVRKRLNNDLNPLVIVNAQPAVVSIIKLLHLQRVFTLRNT